MIRADRLVPVSPALKRGQGAQYEMKLPYREPRTTVREIQKECSMKKEDILGLFDVTGKVALVTGATGAFGSVAAKALAAVGGMVMLTGRNLSKLEQYETEIRKD